MSAATRFIHDQNALPTMPEVASALLGSLDDERLSLDYLSRLIAQDASLSAKVLRLANSTHYSPSHQVDKLSDAAAALGLQTLRNISMAACMSGAFPQVAGLDRKRFWHHSLATAGYAHMLARWLQLDGESAYLAGLMLRTGQLLMAQDDPAQVADVEAHAQEPGSRSSLEMHRFGCTHADVTAELAALWHFPAGLVEAFKDASEPMDVRPFSLLAGVLRMAEILADALDAGQSPRKALQHAVPDLLEHLHLDLDWLDAKLSAAGDPVAGMDSLLH
ncbi:MAG: HDOD domain-containing protein [Burkholderiaceae bacterium]|nr:HDOD domain-containing protein [Burkholderiaceae bacterium]